MTSLKLRSAPLAALSLLACSTILFGCNTNESPRPQVSAEQTKPGQTPTQVVPAAAPLTAAVAAEPTAPGGEGAAQPAAAGSTAEATAPGAVAAAPGSKATAEGAAAPAAGSTRGPAASNDTYTTWLETVGNYTAGQAGQVRLVLEAKAPYHTNEEYPYKFSFGAPVGGVSYPTAVVKEMKIAEMSASMPLPIQAAAKGPATVQGTFNFSVCSKDKCLIEKANLTLPIEIK